MSGIPNPLGQIRISPPHASTSTPFEHIDVDFINPEHGSGQMILPFGKLHIPSPCQPDFDPTPGWEPGPGQ